MENRRKPAGLPTDGKYLRGPSEHEIVDELRNICNRDLVQVWNTGPLLRRPDDALHICSLCAAILCSLVVAWPVSVRALRNGHKNHP